VELLCVELSSDIIMCSHVILM